MDFIKILPMELSELIFQFLTVKELLDVCLVSKTWNSFISESTNLMRIVKFVLKEISEANPLISDANKNLPRSTRVYQNIEIKKVSKNTIENIINIFHKKIVSVKSLELTDLHFNTTKNIADLVGIFEPTLKQIELNNVYIESFEKNHCHQFEKLKVLKLINVNSDINVCDIFTNCKHLTEFRISSRMYTTEYIGLVVNLLNRNEKLKVLEISLPTNRLVISTLTKNSEIPFKLHTFETSNQHSTCSRESYVKFFENQFNSLQKLSFQLMPHLENVQIIFNMPNLKELNLGRVDKLNFKNVRLSVNESIQKLSFIDMTKEFSTVNALVKAAPNVKELKIYSVTQDMIELVSTEMQQLEILTMRTIDAEEVNDESLFPKLTKCSVEIISSELEDRMESIPVEKRNTLVRLILASNYIILH